MFAQADEDTMFEIGSITKVLTGELLAIAVERGRWHSTTRSGSTCRSATRPRHPSPFGRSPPTRSGLPREPTDAAWVAEAEAAFDGGPQWLNVDRSTSCSSSLATRR